MPVNVSDPEYSKAEKEYFEAEDAERRLIALNKMISHAPKHKSSENLLANLKTKRKRIEGEIEKKQKRRRGTKMGIKKGELQVVIVGKTNSGKSSLIKLLTNVETKVSSVPFTTKEPIVGILNYNETPIQLIEIPAIESEEFERGIVHTSDTIILIARKFEDFEEIEKKLPENFAKKLYVINKSDLLTSEEKRKLSAKLQSKKHNFEIISSIPYTNPESIEELKKKIFETFDILRIFTKEPGKTRKNKPMTMKPHSTVRDAAEKILKGFSKKVVETKIWGPSSKFGGQIVGLNHELKDMDTVEFKTR